MAEQIYINSLLAAVSILIVTMIYRVSKLYLAYEKETKENTLKDSSSHSVGELAGEKLHTADDESAYQLKAA